MGTVTDAVSVSHTVDRMPGKNGGMLRRGGGQVARDDSVRAILRNGAKDAAKALVKKADEGNVRAIELLLAYVLGKPKESLELSGPNGGPIELLQGFDDHERRALRDAIDAELARRAEPVA